VQRTPCRSTRRDAPFLPSDKEMSAADVADAIELPRLVVTTIGSENDRRINRVKVVQVAMRRVTCKYTD